MTLDAVVGLPVAFVRRPWGLVVVRGREATSFLQAIVSQDLDPVAVGQTVPSLLLQPQGKLEVAFRATRRAGGDGDHGDDEWWLDTEAHVAERLAAGLARFRIRIDAALEDRTTATACASFVGIGTDALGDGSAAADGDGLVVVATEWDDQPGVDVVGPADAVAEWVARVGVRVGGDDELEVARIAAGIPKHDVDVDQSTIPQEAFLERDAVSFTKGCFVGQELVCRIDSRGHVNRFLRRLELRGGSVPAPGTPVTHGDRTVGSVTSAAAVPGQDRVVALAMIRREVDPDTPLTVGPVRATIVGA